MITCVNNMNIDMLRIAGTGITLVLTTVFMTGMADDKARGRLVTPVIRLSHDFLKFSYRGKSTKRQNAKFMYQVSRKKCPIIVRLAFSQTDICSRTPCPVVFSTNIDTTFESSLQRKIACQFIGFNLKNP